MGARRGPNQEKEQTFRGWGGKTARKGIIKSNLKKDE